MYGAIRRAAYALDPAAAPWTADYRALPFPRHWRADLLELCNFRRPEEKRLKTVPTRRLDGVLQALAPDLIGRPQPRPAPAEDPPSGEDFWLYVPAGAPAPLPGPAMGQLLDAWLPTLGPKEHRDDPEYRALVLRTCAALKADLPKWQHIAAVDLLTTSTSDGGTARPEPRQFQLAADALARSVLALGPHEFDGGRLHFRAVPTQRGAELMSQPLCRTVKRKEWWFSVVLSIRLHTVPFEARPRLHLDWSVRRWATHPRTRTGRLPLPYGQATSVYLLANIPWLPGAPTSDRHAVARLVRPHGSEEFDWLHNDPAGILRHLSMADRFPSVDDVLSDPVSHLGEDRGVRAAVVHGSRMGTHEIGRGFMPNQRSQLTEWAEEALPKGLLRLPDLTRHGRGKSAPANRRPHPTTDEAKQAELRRSAQARRAALAAATTGEEAATTTDGLRPVVEARLLWQTAELRRQAIASFAEALGLDDQPQNGAAGDQECDEAQPGAPVVLHWRTPELDLSLRCLPMSDGLGEALALDSSVRGKGARISQAVAARRQAVRNHLKADGAEPAAPSLALVEIAHPSTFRPKAGDPKFAVRLGCADAGVLTQFAVTPSADRAIKNEGNLEHRTLNAWFDGLRQLGVRVLPEHTLGGDLPEGLEYAALWMVKRRKDGPTRLPRHLPVAVRMVPLPGPAGLARVQGWDDELRDWVPYPDFLLGLVKKAEITPDAYSETASDIPAPRRAEPHEEPQHGGSTAAAWVTSAQWHRNLQQQRQETARFLQHLLHSLRGRQTVLITHAQNSRKHWPWLQDGKVVQDLLQAGHASARRLDEGLRVVRVRSNGGYETPQWWGVAEPGKPNGQPAGFWALPTEENTSRSSTDRVFYSTTDRARSHPVSPSLDRLATRVTAAGTLTSQAGTDAWNPALVELAVLGCHTEQDDTAERHAGGGDKPEAIALAMHQLRQAPDHPDALALPLPLHLARLAQAYVLPTLAEEDEASTEAADGLSEDSDSAGTAEFSEEPQLDGSGLNDEEPWPIS